MNGPSNASQHQDLDARYVAARRVLLDALTVLAPHGDAIILAGAQAVYLHTGTADLAIAPYTTDGDLVLDPLLLGEAPELEAGMSAAGFHLQQQPGGHVEPGIWLASASAAGEEFLVPVDLIVPEGAASGTGRRAARLGGHGARAARRAVGLEAALVDNSRMTIAALDPADARSLQARVAGPAALLVAKAHKLHDRVASGRSGLVDRLDCLERKGQSLNAVRLSVPPKANGHADSSRVVGELVRGSMRTGDIFTIDAVVRDAAPISTKRASLSTVARPLIGDRPPVAAEVDPSVAGIALDPDAAHLPGAVRSANGYVSHTLGRDAGRQAGWPRGLAAVETPSPRVRVAVAKELDDSGASIVEDCGGAIGLRLPAPLGRGVDQVSDGGFGESRQERQLQQVPDGLVELVVRAQLRLEVDVGRAEARHHVGSSESAAPMILDRRRQRALDTRDRSELGLQCSAESPLEVALAHADLSGLRCPCGYRGHRDLQLARHGEQRSRERLIQRRDSFALVHPPRIVPTG
jgi:hypothetical protein